MNTETEIRLALGCVRASTDEQINSVEVQSQQIEGYCAYRKFTLVKTFPAHISATQTKFLERPSNIEMLEFADQTRARDIIISKVDRAFRSVLDLEQTANELIKRGFTLHFLDLQVDTSTAMGKAMLQMAAVFAELESRRRAERQTETLEVLKVRKRVIGTIPYGMMASPDDAMQLVPHPKEQQALLLIRDWHQVYGKGAAAIANLLNDRGIPTKTGTNKWAKSTVTGILSRLTDLIVEPQHHNTITPEQDTNFETELDFVLESIALKTCATA